MEVTFHNGKIYHYHDVPEKAHDSFHKAESLGTHFHKHIKNGFKTKKVK
jgi:hypothetical protein